MSVHLLGIRHHGPGSARNVKAFLKNLKPDIILVEGPPECEPMLQWVIHKQMKPPVALLVYVPDKPQKAAFYPFAAFSAEWQALYYGTYNNIPTRFFDLPITHSFALDLQEEEKEKTAEVKSEEVPVGAEDQAVSNGKDPFGHFAEINGFNDGELWWEMNFENRIDNNEIFGAINEAVSALRDTLPEKDDRREKLREAWMRKVLRTAEKDGFERIAVICGAWHVHALSNMPKQKDDNELLKSLPKVKIETTWIPWTYNRLTFRSGYGAGIHSPGWYDHLWNHPDDDGTRWMSKVAQLLRRNNMDTSVAHVIEAVRLANSLAALRNFSRPGLDELNEATISVIGFGDDILLRLIQEELMVSDKLGEVPEEVPRVPLLIDLEKQQKSLRMPASSGIKEYNLDLRQPNDLARSVLLHRLLVLGIEWGEQKAVSSKGTFKEQWHLMWEPEFSIKVIEQGVWGNTLEEAAGNYLVHLASKQPSISELAVMIEQAIPADLPKAVESLTTRLDNLAATSNDVLELMKALPAIANVSRYGNVRKTDADMLSGIAQALITRISVGLPMATIGIDEDAAQALLNLIMEVNHAVNLLQLSAQSDEWHQSLMKIQDSQGHPLIAGYSCRLLFDQKVLNYDEVAVKFSFALSAASEPMQAAYWVEGFLKGSGTILLLDDNLWGVLNEWVTKLDDDIFLQLLPLMRRTFSAFTNAERKKIGEKAKSGPTGKVITTTEENFDYERGMKGVPVVIQLLGLSKQ